jgi:hypothetical protein
MSNINKPLFVILTYALLLACIQQCRCKAKAVATAENFKSSKSSSNGGDTTTAQSEGKKTAAKSGDATEFGDSGGGRGPADSGGEASTTTHGVGTTSGGGGGTTDSGGGTSSTASGGRTASGGESSITDSDGHCDPIPQAGALNTRLRGQQASNWCWAASAQMIFAILGDTVKQCDEVERIVRTSDCCGEETPGPCNIVGFPPFADYNFYADSTEPGNALPWDSIQRQIGCLRAPICAKWRWTDNGQPTDAYHFIVLVAYEVQDGEQMVTILNPLPQFQGSIRTIPYSEFVQSPDIQPHVHGKDYYNIKKEN